MNKYASIALLLLAVVMIPVYILHERNSFKKNLSFIEGWQYFIDSYNKETDYLLVFVDLECEFCQDMDKKLDKLDSNSELVIKKIYHPILSNTSLQKAVLAKCLKTHTPTRNVDNIIYNMPSDSINQNKYELYLGNNKNFKLCINSSSISNEIVTQKNFALDLGIDSVPTTVINGYKIVGNAPIEDVQYLIENL